MHIDLDMGKYAFFVWGAYGASVVGLVSLTVVSLRANRQRRKTLAALQAAAKDAPRTLAEGSGVMAMKRLLALLPLIIFAVLLAVLAFYNFHKKATYEPRAMVGKAVPAVVLSDVQDGTPGDLKALVGGYHQPVLVNVFASWCTPCVAENPQLMALKAKGVPIIGIAWKDEAKNTLNFLAQHDDPYVKTLSDPDGKMGLALGISGVPETFIVAPDGTITDKISGPIVPDTLDAVLKSAKMP